jgi:cyclopropane-fatty-acyl-phospholipid synthase
MKTHDVHTHMSEVHTTLSVLHEIFSDYHPRNFAIRLWEGTAWQQEEGQDARFTMVLKHPGALRIMLLHPSQLSIGEAYIYDDFDVEGDIEAAFAMANHLMNLDVGLAGKVHLGSQLMKLPADGHPHTGRQAVHLKGALHSKERDREAVTYHYNVSNDFFSLWLDRWMMYSCAYFSSPDEDLDTAQERKLEYLCRKLRLRPGEKLLDIGCGWGGLILYAAKQYGVDALGITLSEPQSVYANERIRREGMDMRCRALVLDYRDLEGIEAYDKIVSVGMFEHVGESMLQEYFGRAFQLLRRGGVFLNHGVGTGFNHVNPSESFNDRYIFPDSEVLPISTTLKAAEVSGFDVRDVESLREHYMHTLHRWLRRLEANHDRAVGFTDEATYRTWRLNHAGAALGFKTGKNTIYQTLLVKPLKGDSMLPLTRADWYV